MLVHPLAHAGATASAATTSTSARRGGDLPLAGLTSPSHAHDHHLRLSDTSKLLDAGLATAELAGRVGEPCCDDEEEEAAAAPAPSSSTSDFNHPPHAASAAEPGVAYYGVVVLGGQKAQKRAGNGETGSNSADAGCYVLKTVRSPSACGCACVYFTLTRVTRGEPLASQLASSWLA